VTEHSLLKAIPGRLRGVAQTRLLRDVELGLPRRATEAKYGTHLPKTFISNDLSSTKVRDEPVHADVPLHIADPYV
jgi:hypothetical protein